MPLTLPYLRAYSSQRPVRARSTIASIAGMTKVQNGYAPTATNDASCRCCPPVNPFAF